MRNILLGLALAAFLTAVPLHSVSNVVCHHDKVTISYGVIDDADVAVVNGGIEFLSDLDLRITVNGQCLADLDPDGAPEFGATAIVVCRDPAGNILVESGARDLIVQDGIVSWEDHQTGRRYLASVPCSILEFE